MKLYTVTAEFEYVIVADDIADAYSVAEDYVRDALTDISYSDIDYTIVPGAKARGWDDMCIPYGGDGDKRTGEYKKENQQ